ncbi:MAG: efflux RND transporter periplasmic adaptor subunit [Acidobacteriaceae bacterium]|nr:efflux RND transporter periplasmic adaptor subunit [Acidobacteriaceae bacterium]MBV9779764.1 efflux RND transporter periplasmic adaptor subunit [Acidobacteriaceae bacterium]
MKKSWLLLIIPVVLGLWWALDSQDSVPEVHFAAVRKLTIESTVSTNGKVEPVDWAAARAETAGMVQRIAVQRGDRVKAGQVLVALDPTAAQSDLAAAHARAQEARTQVTTLVQGGKAATLASLNDSIRSAQAALDVAQRNYDALQRLEREQAATKLQVQDAKDALDRAKLQLAAYEDQRRTLVTGSDRAVAQAKLRDAEAAVALAQHRVALSEIKSPIDGTVYQFDLKIGAYEQPGDLVALVGKLDRVKVIVYVDEPDLGRVAENMPVKITWEAHPGQVWWGRVDRLPTQVVAQGTRTVGEVSTIVGNPNHDLLPGVTVNATIVSAVVRDAPAIPKGALRFIQGTSGVYKLDGKTVAWTPIKTGVSDVNNVQIVSGVSVGDRVAEPSGDVEIRDGMRVNAVKN